MSLKVRCSVCGGIVDIRGFNNHNNHKHDGLAEYEVIKDADIQQATIQENKEESEHYNTHDTHRVISDGNPPETQTETEPIILGNDEMSTPETTVRIIEDKPEIVRKAEEVKQESGVDRFLDKYGDMLAPVVATVGAGLAAALTEKIAGKTPQQEEPTGIDLLGNKVKDF